MVKKIETKLEIALAHELANEVLEELKVKDPNEKSECDTDQDGEEAE